MENHIGWWLFQSIDGPVTQPNEAAGKEAEGVISGALSGPVVDEPMPVDSVMDMQLDHVDNDVSMNPPPSYEEGIFYIDVPVHNDAVGDVPFAPPPSYEKGILYMNKKTFDEAADNVTTPSPQCPGSVSYI